MPSIPTVILPSMEVLTLLQRNGFFVDWTRFKTRNNERTTPALRWKGHVDAVTGKMKTQMRALTCLSAWLPLIQARMVYSMIIRPAMTYGALAWRFSRIDASGL